MLNKLEKINPYMILAFLVSIISFTPFLDPDLCWHIKNGEMILINGLPTMDSFSYFEGLHFMSHEWLFDIIIYKIYNVFGLFGTKVFASLLVFLLFFVVIKIMNKFNGHVFLNVVLVCFVSPFLYMYFEPRPQILTLVLFSLFLYSLLKSIADKNSKLIYLFPLFTFFLANFHGGTLPQFFVLFVLFIIDSFFFGFKTKDFSRFRLFISVFLIGILTSCVNPYGINIYDYAFKILSSSDVTGSISEWQPLLNSHNKFKMVFLFVLIFSPWAVLTLNNKKISLIEFLVLGYISFSVIMYSRMLSSFIVVILIMFGGEYNKLLLKWCDELKVVFGKNKIIVAIVKHLRLSLVFTPLFLVVFGVGYSIYNYNESIDLSINETYPVEALKFIENNDIDVDNNIMFNNYNFGGYLILNDYKVYIDGRADVYMKEFNDGENDIIRDILNFNKLNSDGIHSYLKENNVKYMLDYKGGTYYSRVSSDDRFQELYSDENFILYEILD